MKQQQGGFTLIEAMIAVVLIAIALSLAIPSYRSFVVRSNRTEAIESLLTAAACQERIFIRNNAYDANACGGATPNGFYVIGFTTSNGNLNFVATATPQGAQAHDSCGTLTLSDIGVKVAGGETGAYAQKCWAGKFNAASS